MVDLDQATVGTLLEHQLRQERERSEWGGGYRDHGVVFCWPDDTPLRPQLLTTLFRDVAADVRVPVGPDRPEGSTARCRRSGCTVCGTGSPRPCWRPVSPSAS